MELRLQHNHPWITSSFSPKIVFFNLVTKIKNLGTFGNFQFLGLRARISKVHHQRTLDTYTFIWYFLAGNGLRRTPQLSAIHFWLERSFREVLCCWNHMSRGVNGHSRRISSQRQIFIHFSAELQLLVLLPLLSSIYLLLPEANLWASVKIP